MAKRSNRRYWILLLLVFIGVILYLVNSKENENATTLYNLEKTGAGVTADYSVAAKRIHSAVDSALASAGLSVRGIQEDNRETPRQRVEGSIRWHARQLLLAVDADTKIEAVEHALEAGLKDSGGEVLANQPDSYQGLPAVRIDVGLRDSLEGDPLVIVTERIYVTRNKAETATVKKEKGKIAIIIDDFGYNSEPIAMFAAISRPITFSVLPYRPYSNEAASRALSSGHQVMLHLPMEPLENSGKTEPTVITVSMSDQEIRQTVSKAIQAVPGIVGVNNHQGSKATADRRVMKDVLKVLKDNGLFFVDSRTNSQSAAYEVSRQTGLLTGENELFIDNSKDVDAIKQRLKEAAGMAIRHGSVTVIGHAHPNTATAIREMIPEIEDAGVSFVFESQLVK